MLETKLRPKTAREALGASASHDPELALPPEKRKSAPRKRPAPKPTEGSKLSLDGAMSLLDVLKPNIRYNGQDHMLEAMVKAGQKLPVMKAVGYMKIGPKRSDYISYVLTFQGATILSIEVDEPNLRAIAEDNTKVNFVEIFQDPEV